MSSIFLHLKAQLQAEVFGRMFAPKMAALEKIFKESMNSRGFFIGDYVSICKFCILVCFLLPVTFASLVQ